MRKWVTLIIVIILVAVTCASWQEKRSTKVTVNILNSMPLIDSITVKDAKTKESILNFKSSDTSFSEMIEIYKLPYKDLKWAERKLLKKEPFIEVEYLKDNEIQYTVSIYQLKDEDQSTLSIENAAGVRSYKYSYSLEEENTNYIFALKENYQLLGVNEGLKEIVNMTSTK